MKLTIKFNKKKPIKETSIITKIRAGVLSHNGIMLKGAKDYYFFIKCWKLCHQSAPIKNLWFNCYKIFQLLVHGR